MRLLKQPLIMGYILTGVVVGPHFLNILKDIESGEIFSLMGISILLFIVGLSLSPHVIREVGKISLITGTGQVMFTTFLGFMIAKGFGYEFIPSLYIAISLAFSSTIIILKLLSDKKDLEKLYGKIAIGFLIVQDIIATLILIGISSFTSGQDILQSALLVLIKGISAAIVLSFISYYLLPKLSDFFAKSQEYLFLFAVGWGFGLASVFKMMGFSAEIGALVAGVTLSMSPYAREISAKLKPLRDFFLIMFFILLGVNMDITSLSGMLVPALIFSTFVLVGNPIIVILLMELLGYNRKTGFKAGLTVAQISEFSLIIILLGVKLGHIDRSVLSIVTLVGLITISVSTYMIKYSDKIYPYIYKYIGFLEKKKVIQEKSIVSNYDVILFGCNRVGYDFIRMFKYLGAGFLAVDFNPEVIKELSDAGVNCEYGDAEDSDFLDEIYLDKAKLIISTIPDYDANEFLLEKIRSVNEEAGVILMSYSVEDAIEFYDMGASYVILPHFIGGTYGAGLAQEIGTDPDKLHEKRQEHINYLRERKEKGHAHPIWMHH
jgi:Kef-type K+ transport system membrane component KefB